MSDLIDYLRDKLEHADDPVCTCSRVYVGWDNPPKTVPGRTNPNCAIHGGAIATWTGGFGREQVVIERRGEDPEIWVNTEPSRKRWWRR